MSAEPAKLGDPADKALDAKADGQFQPVHRRSGYGKSDAKFARLRDYIERNPDANGQTGELGMFLHALQSTEAASERYKAAAFRLVRHVVEHMPHTTVHELSTLLDIPFEVTLL